MKDFSFPRERCVLQTYGMTLHNISRLKKNPFALFRCMNREQAVYVRRVFCVP